MTPIGNCTSEEVIEELFGDVSHFACLVDEYGDNFIIDNIEVKYDEETDIHWFYPFEEPTPQDTNHTSKSKDQSSQ